MNVVLDTLYLRKPRIEYVSPPICDAIFSSSGGPVIILPDIERLKGPTGGRAGGRGKRYFSFDRYPGQICWSIYVAVDPGNPQSPYNLISECIPDGSIALCSEGYYEISAINGQGHESPRSSPIFVSGDGYTIVTLPLFPQTVAYNLYKSTGAATGPYHLYWYGFSGNSFEVCVPGCYRITAITGDGETPPSDPTCTDFTCQTLTCPPGTGWNPLLCECVPCDLTENPCPPGFIWRPSDCSCIASGGGGGDLTDLLPPETPTQVNAPYDSDVTAVGGTGPFVWSLVGGALPDGLHLDPQADGPSVAIQGTPTVVGDFNFTILCQDVVGDFMQKDFTIKVQSCVDWHGLVWSPLATDPQISVVAQNNSVVINSTTTLNPGAEYEGMVVYNGGACDAKLNIAVTFTPTNPIQNFGYVEFDVVDSLGNVVSQTLCGVWGVPIPGMLPPGTYQIDIPIPSTAGQDDTFYVFAICQMASSNYGGGGPDGPGTIAAAMSIV